MPPRAQPLKTAHACRALLTRTKTPFNMWLPIASLRRCAFVANTLLRVAAYQTILAPAPNVQKVRIQWLNQFALEA